MVEPLRSYKELKEEIRSERLYAASYLIRSIEKDRGTAAQEDNRKLLKSFRDTLSHYRSTCGSSCRNDREFNIIMIELNRFEIQLDEAEKLLNEERSE